MGHNDDDGETQREPCGYSRAEPSVERRRNLSRKDGDFETTWLNSDAFGVKQCTAQTNSSARVNSVPSDQQYTRAQTGVHVFKQISVTGLTDLMRVDSWISVQTESKQQKRTGRQRPQSSPSLTPSYRSDSSEQQWPVPYESVEFFPRPVRPEHRARQKQLRNPPIYESLPSSLEKVRGLPSEHATREDTKCVDIKEDMGPIPVGTLSKCSSSVLVRQKSIGDRLLSAPVVEKPKVRVTVNSKTGKLCSDISCWCQESAAVYQLQETTSSSENPSHPTPSKSTGQETICPPVKTVPEPQIFPHHRTILSDEYRIFCTRPVLDPDSNVVPELSSGSIEPRATMQPEAAVSSNLDLKISPGEDIEVQQYSQEVHITSINREDIPNLTTCQNVCFAMTGSSGTLNYTAVDVNNMVQFSSSHIQHYSTLPNDLRLALTKAFEAMLRNHLGLKRLLRATWDCVTRLLTTKYGEVRGENSDSMTGESSVPGTDTVNTGTVGYDCTDPNIPSEATTVLGELYQEIFGSVPKSSEITKLVNKYITSLDSEHLKELFQEQFITVVSEPTEQELQGSGHTYQKIAQGRSSQSQPIRRSSPTIQIVFDHTCENVLRSKFTPPNSAPQTSRDYLINLNSGQVERSPEPLHTEHAQKMQHVTPASSSQTKHCEISQPSTARQSRLPVNPRSTFERVFDEKTRCEKTPSYLFLVPNIGFIDPEDIQSMKEELTSYPSEAVLNDSGLIQLGCPSNNFRIAFSRAFVELLQSEHGLLCLFPTAAWKYISSCIIHRSSHPAPETKKAWKKHTTINTTPMTTTTNTACSSRTGALRTIAFDPRAVFERVYEEVIHSWLESSQLFLLTAWNYITSFLAQRHPEIIEEMTENLRQASSVGMMQNTGAPSDFPGGCYLGFKTVEITPCLGYPNAPESIFFINPGDIRYLSGILGEKLDIDVVPILLQTRNASAGPVRYHTSMGLKTEQPQEVGSGSLLTMYSASECVWVDPNHETCSMITVSSSVEGVIPKQAKYCFTTSVRLEKDRELDRSYKSLQYTTVATVVIRSTILGCTESYINVEYLTIQPGMYVLTSVVLTSSEHRLTLQTFAESTQYLININVNLFHSSITGYLVSSASDVLEPLQCLGYVHIRPSRIPDDCMIRAVEISHVVMRLEDSRMQSHYAYSTSKRPTRGNLCLIRNPPVTRSHSQSSRLSRSIPTVQPPPYPPPHKSSLVNQVRTYSISIPDVQSTNDDLERVSRLVTWDWNRQFGQPGQPIPNYQEFGRVNMQDEYEIRRRQVSIQGSQPSVTINLGALVAGQHYDLEIGDITGFRIGIRAHDSPISQMNATGEASMDRGNESATDTVNPTFGNGSGKPLKNCMPITRIFRRKSASSHLR